jgi:hypothetical protein
MSRAPTSRIVVPMEPQHPARRSRARRRDHSWRIRLLGLGMFAYGAAMLALLATPWRQWALEHSIAEVVSWSDRRAGNGVSGAVDEPMAVAGSAVMMVAGAWFGLLVPWVLNRHIGAMAADVQRLAERERVA